MVGTLLLKIKWHFVKLLTTKATPMNVAQCGWWQKAVAEFCRLMPLFMHKCFAFTYCFSSHNNVDNILALRAIWRIIIRDQPPTETPHSPPPQPLWALVLRRKGLGDGEILKLYFRLLSLHQETIPGPGKEWLTTLEKHPCFWLNLFQIIPTRWGFWARCFICESHILFTGHHQPFWSVASREECGVLPNNVKPL